MVLLTAGGVYQLNRISDPEDATNCAAEWSIAQRHRKPILATFTASLLLSLILATKQGAAYLLVVSTCFLLGFAYSNPIAGGRFRLKRAVVFKEALPSLGWSLLTVVLRFNAPVRLVMLAAIYNSLQVAIIESVWKIRDAQGDRMEGVKSFAIRLGVERTVRLAHVLNVLAATLILGAWRLAWVDTIWLLAVLNSIFVAAWLAAGKRHLDKRPFSHAMQAGEAMFAFLAGILANFYYG